MALSGHYDRAEPCPLLGVKRTSLRRAAMSAFDPKRTSPIKVLDEHAIKSVVGYWPELAEIVGCDGSRNPVREERQSSHCLSSHRRRTYRSRLRPWLDFPHRAPMGRTESCPFS